MKEMTEMPLSTNYDLELRGKLEGELLEKWEKIRERRHNKRMAWGRLLEWLITEEKMDSRLTVKRLVSFCRRHGRTERGVEAWAGKVGISRVRKKSTEKEEVPRNKIQEEPKIVDKVFAKAPPKSRPVVLKEEIRKETPLIIGPVQKPLQVPALPTPALPLSKGHDLESTEIEAVLEEKPKALAPARKPLVTEKEMAEKTAREAQAAQLEKERLSTEKIELPSADGELSEVDDWWS